MSVSFERTHEDAVNCSVNRTLGVIGDRWTLLILRELFYGASRFDQIHDVLRCPRNLLSGRLDRLVTDGVLERLPYQEPGRRARTAYHLTDRGRELLPILIALLQWGDEHLAESGPPVFAEHAGCGTSLRVVLECEHGHRDIKSEELYLRPGPGMRPQGRD
jgi:DNA-binding HxlR family transcriptional regulator